MKGQSAYKAPRSGGPMMKGIPQPQGSFSGPAGMGPQRMPQAPMGMATRPPVIANKARGTMASHTYSPISNSVSGMGQSGFAPQGVPRMPMGGIAQPQGSFTGPAGVGRTAFGPKRMA